jgi:long-subunit fatty acid transport protein
VPFHVGDEALALGLVSRSPGDVIASANIPYPETPQFPLLVNRMRALDLALGLGFRVGERLSLGAGFRALASLGGTVNVEQDASGRSRTAIEDELTPAYAPTLGARIDPGDGVALALVWRAALQADFDVRIAETDLGAVKLPELSISGVAQYDPMELSAEVSRKIGDFRIAAAITFRRWSAFPGWLSPTTACPSTRPACAALGPDAVAIDDTWVPRFGVTYGFDLAPAARAEARAGYFFEPSPLGAQTQSSNTWDNARHAITAGYGLELTAPLFPLRIDAAVQYHALVSRTHQKDAGVPPDNAGSPEVTTSGHVLSFALSTGVKF